MTTSPSGVNCAGVRPVWRTVLAPSPGWRPQEICTNLNQVPAAVQLMEAGGSVDVANGATRPVTHSEIGLIVLQDGHAVEEKQYVQKFHAFGVL